MSFELTDSGNIYCSARSGYAGRGLTRNRVTVGDYEIEIGDFCALVEYVFTNTDLDANDVRETYAERFKHLVAIPGYNEGNVRLGYETVKEDRICY